MNRMSYIFGFSFLGLGLGMIFENILAFIVIGFGLGLIVEKVMGQLTNIFASKKENIGDDHS